MGNRDPAEEDVARWRFGEAVLDERTMELLVGGRKVELARKPLELLMFLVRNPGEVVTKEELFEAVWPGRIVSEASLTNAIARLRTALGDEKSQQLLKSVYGFGYRFMGEVVREDARAAVLAVPVSALDFHEGEAVPGRAGWLLSRHLGGGGGGEAWLALEAATHDARVFKFARDRLALSALKREITLSRLMRESLGERPDFVRVLDWSLDEPPYFIATDYCNQGSLGDWAAAGGGIATIPLEQRLELLAQAAEALAAAHSVGVLHKDIKPGNLLLHRSPKVDAERALQLSIADFGSARLVDRTRLQSLAIAELGFTQTLADTTSGTPLYLAPELGDGSPPTIRSDIYALGVVLYQLAVGDLRRSLAPGWELRIDDPLLIDDIGAAAAGDPQHRLADAAVLAQRLRALPQRRIARARRLEEVRIAAATREALERARTRRSWWMALALVSLAGLSLTLWQVLVARASAREANAVSAFLVDDVLGAADPINKAGSELTVKWMLDQAATRLADRLQDQPHVRASIGLGLAKAYNSTGDWPTEQRTLETALKDAESVEGPSGLLTLKIVSQLAVVFHSMNQYDRAREMDLRVVANAGRLGEDNPLVLESLNDLAYLEYRAGRFAEGAKLYEELLPRVTRLGDKVRMVEINLNLPDLYNELGRSAEAETLARRGIALDMETQHLSPDSAKVYWDRVTLADTLSWAGHTDEALREFAATRAGLVATLGPEHPYALTALQYWGRCLLLSGDAKSALPMFEQMVEIRKRTLGDASIKTHTAAGLLGRTLVQLGRADEAVPILEKAMAGYLALFPPQHPSLVDIHCNLAEALLKAGDRTRALQVLAVVQPWAERVLPPNGPRMKRYRQVAAELAGA